MRKARLALHLLLILVLSSDQAVALAQAIDRDLSPPCPMQMDSHDDCDCCGEDCPPSMCAVPITTPMLAVSSGEPERALHAASPIHAATALVSRVDRPPLRPPIA